MSKQLLIIEDDIGLLSFYHKVLAHMGYDLTIVKTRQEALLAIDEAEYEFIICDIELGSDNMLDFIASCGEHKKSMIVISANDSYIKDCLDMGVRAFVRKPILANDLLRLAEGNFDPNNRNIHVASS